MRQVLEMAKGGVLMIDEAYLLNGKHENDPGKLVVQLLKTSRLSRCPARKQKSVFDDATRQSSLRGIRLTEREHASIVNMLSFSLWHLRYFSIFAPEQVL